MGAIRNALLSSVFVALGLVAAVMATIPHAAAAAPRPKASAFPTPYGATVPVGVDVPVELITQINSATFNVGDSFAFKTTKQTKLGTLSVPAGTAGHGRISSVDRATNKHDGSISIQVDSIDLADGTPVWVDMNPKSRLEGHLADKHTRFLVVAISTDYSGNMILEPGTPFDVVTIAKRAAPAVLVTESPSTGPSPIASPAASAAPAASPMGMASAMPAASPSP